MTAMAPNADLLRFLSSLEDRPSAIHGTGVFAERSIEKGATHRTSDPALVSLYLFTAAKNMNSALVPPWKNLLVKTAEEFDAAGGGGIQNMDENSLSTLRSRWMEYTTAELSKAHVLVKTQCLQPLTAAVTVFKDVTEGQEVTRAYGHGWLAIKYYQLKVCQLMYAKKAPPRANQTLKFVVDMKTLDVKGTFYVEASHSWVGVAAELESEDILVASASDLANFADHLEYVANVVAKGDPSFDVPWNNSLSRLQQEFPGFQKNSIFTFLGYFLTFYSGLAGMVEEEKYNPWEESTEPAQIATNETEEEEA